MWKELEGKQAAVWDAETDGFVDNMTTAHCITITDAQTQEVFRYRDILEACKKLDTYDVHVGHNLIGFDYPMLKTHYGWERKASTIVLDTLWLSRLYYCDIEGGHSLGAWGARLGEPKTEYYPVSDKDQPLYNAEEPNPKKNPCWIGSIWTQSMEDYCVQDTNVNEKLYHKLLKLLANFSWQSIICEMQTAVIIQRQMTHGFVFDYKAAEILHGEFIDRVGELEDEVLATFKPLAKFVREIQPKVRMNGTMSSVGLKKHIEIYGTEDIFPVPEFTRLTHDPQGNECKSVEYHSGSFSAVEWPEFSLGSRAQIAERLTRAGYKLTEFTEKGTPMINDAVLQVAADAGIPEAKPLAEYFMITKREGMLKSWLEKARWHEDQGVYRIHGYVNSLGAGTHRMTHAAPNVAQVPAPKSPYGKECRKLFTIRKGYKLVGCDASGLELRMLSHYMNDDKYTKELLEGDIHTANQLAAGLPTRDLAKTFIYGFLYGGGDAKIGQIVGGGSKEGKALKKKFLEGTPALKKLREGVANAVKERPWLKGLDGRIVRVRSPHSAVNTLLQSAGAIVCKYWLIEFMRVLDSRGIYAQPCANIHDEASVEVKEEDAEEVAKVMEEAFLTVSSMLKSNCLLEGEAKIGETWYDVH